MKSKSDREGQNSLGRTIDIGSRSRQAARIATHVLEHVAAMIVGVILLVVGMGLTVTVVFLPAGITAMLLGTALLVTSLFAHASGGP